ncbi:MAG: hypothetical protein ABSG02_17310 [Terriglobales bacterium]
MTMFITVAIIALAACGDPKGQAPAIVVAFDPNFPPPTSLDTGAYAGIAAILTNDTGSGNVTWTCAPANQCGSFSPNIIHTAVPTCYLAPDAVPSGKSVTVTARSVTDTTKSISATITILSGPGQACP